MEAIAASAVAPDHPERATPGRPPIPFDAGRLDALMDEAGIDALVVTSKHNIQYLLGGYRFFFFDHFDAIGVSRYLPVLVYVKGDPERAAYIGHPMESYERELNRFWVPAFSGSARMSTDGIEAAIERLTSLAPKAPRSASSAPFCRPIPRALCARDCLRPEFVEAQLPLERLRAVKTPRELEYLRKASDLVVDSMLAVIAGAQTRHDQARAGRSAAPRGGQSRPYL